MSFLGVPDLCSLPRLHRSRQGGVDAGLFGHARVAASSGGAAAAREAFWEFEDLTGLTYWAGPCAGWTQMCPPPWRRPRHRAQRRSERRLAAGGAAARGALRLRDANAALTEEWLHVGE